MLGRDGLVKDCSVVLEMYRSSGLPPDLACYNHTLRAYVNTGDGVGASKLLEYMLVNAKLICTVVSFNEVLNAHCNSERIDMEACEDVLVSQCSIRNFEKNDVQRRQWRERQQNLFETGYR